MPEEVVLAKADKELPTISKEEKLKDYNNN